MLSGEWESGDTGDGGAGLALGPTLCVLWSKPLTLSGPCLFISQNNAGLDQLSPRANALALVHELCTDGKATEDNAFMQAGSTRPSPLITILQSDKSLPK